MFNNFLAAILNVIGQYLGIALCALFEKKPAECMGNSGSMLKTIDETKGGGSGSTSEDYQQVEANTAGPFQNDIGAGLTNANEELTKEFAKTAVISGTAGVVGGFLAANATGLASLTFRQHLSHGVFGMG